MKTYREVLIDSFIDFKGDTHYFVIVALSKPFEKADILYRDNGDLYCHQMTKGISIGISICNPLDEFNEEIGIMRAEGRARKNEVSLFSNKNIYINSQLVQIILQQEAKRIKNNPEKYIAGYKSEQEKWLKNQLMQMYENNLSNEEKVVVDKIKKDKSYLDKIKEYMNWLNAKK